MLLLDDDAELPAQPDEAEAALAERIGPLGVERIDEALKHHTRTSWLKVARVVHDAMDANGASVFDETCLALYVRRIIVLVDAGALKSQGNVRKPRWSEVRLLTR
jgi:hypothetical protein